MRLRAGCQSYLGDFEETGQCNSASSPKHVYTYVADPGGAASATPVLKKFSRFILLSSTISVQVINF